MMSSIFQVTIIICLETIVKNKLEEDGAVPVTGSDQIDLAEQLLYYSQDMIAIVECERLTFLDANRSLLDRMGWCREDIIGHSILEPGLLSPDYDELTYMRTALNENNGPVNMTFHPRTSHQQRLELGLSYFPARYRALDCWLFYFHDLSHQYRPQQELTHLDRLRRLGEMAAVVGHEVRNPMTTVRGFLQMLQMQDPSSESIPYFSLMIEELDRANDIISEFLGMARPNQPDLCRKSLSAIVSALQPMLRALALSKDLNLQLFLDDEARDELMLDESEVRQLIINLACNGLDAMRPPGTLTISTRREGTEMVLAVRDQGVGIAADVLESINVPFFTTKPGGTGLGLPVCYRIAARHGACIEVSTGPEGTTFYVRFPLD